jgi:hypothetical protein
MVCCTKCLEQSNDNSCINSEPATKETSAINAEKGDVAQRCVESSADEQENQEMFPVTGTDASDSTSVTSMEDGLEPKKGAQSEPGDVSGYPPDLSNDKSSTGNGNVYDNAKCVLTSSTKKMKVISFFEPAVLLKPLFLYFFTSSICSLLSKVAF